MLDLFRSINESHEETLGNSLEFVCLFEVTELVNQAEDTIYHDPVLSWSTITFRHDV